MKALITGAGGYLASYLIPYLRTQNLEVEALSSRKLDLVPSHLVNWKSTEDLAVFLKQSKPNYIFHLAGTRETSSLSQFCGVNVLYAANLFDALVKSGLMIPTLVVGSAGEYGPSQKNNIEPLHEEKLALPATEYGTAKYLQTLIAIKAAERGVPVVAARLFNLIGPRMPTSLVIGSFIAKLQNSLEQGRREILMGNLNAQRDFIDVRDVSEIFLKLVQNPKSFGQIVNVCSGRASQVGEVINRLQYYLGTRIEIKTEVSLSNEKNLDFSLGCNKRLLSLIGNYKFRSLEDSLRFIAESFDTKSDFKNLPLELSQS